MAKIKDMLAYAQGNIRYKLYYSKVLGFLMRIHIREQITARIRSMDVKCYQDGACKLCGCTTTALQMADKACDKPCYPRMLNRYEWLKLKIGYAAGDAGHCWTLVDNKFKEYRHV